MISYDPLHKTLERRGMTQHDLLDIVGFGHATFNRIHNNQSVTMATIENLCRILGCSIEDVVVIIPEDDWEPYVPDPNIPRKKRKK